MNTESIKKKLIDYQLKTTARKVVRDYEKLGVDFVNLHPRNLQKRYKMRNLAKTFHESFGKVPEPKKETVMVTALKKYLAETPKEQIEFDWNAVKDLNIQGPTVKEFMKNQMKDMKVEKIIDEAYSLYMPQIRSEITDLAQFLLENTDLQFGRPIKVLEIGTKFGGTFLIWNRLNPDGMNISIDFSDGGIHGGVSEEEMDKRDLWFQERFPNCHFIRGDSHSFSTPIKLNRLLHTDKEIQITSHAPNLFEPKFDFLFIDGDHSFSGVKSDFEMYSPFVKKGGIVVFHDTVVSDRHHERNVYVGEFWRELTRNRMPENESICIIDDQEWEIVEFVEHGNDWAGISTLTKL